MASGIVVPSKASPMSQILESAETSHEQACQCHTLQGAVMFMPWFFFFQSSWLHFSISWLISFGLKHLETLRLLGFCTGLFFPKNPRSHLHSCNCCPCVVMNWENSKKCPSLWEWSIQQSETPHLWDTKSKAASLLTTASTRTITQELVRGSKLWLGFRKTSPISIRQV